MTDISIETYAGKMNRTGYDAFLKAMRHARSEGNRNVGLPHFIFHALSDKDSDLSVTLRELQIDRARVLQDADASIAALSKNVTETPGISENLADALNHAWTYSTLFEKEGRRHWFPRRSSMDSLPGPPAADAGSRY